MDAEPCRIRPDMKSRIYFLALSLVVLLIGCMPAASPATAPRLTLKVVYGTLNPDVLPGWVAKDAGFFEKNGLDVEFLYVDGGLKSTQALLSKDAAFGMYATSTPINANAAGSDFVFIAGVINTLPYNIVAVPDIKTGADLKGKKFAVASLSGGTYTAMRIGLRQLYGLDPAKDVTPVLIGTDATRENALVLKQVDAAMLHGATADIAKRDGLVILDSMWDKGIEYQFTTVTVSKAYLNEHPGAGERFLKSIIQATGYIKDPANKTAVIKSLSKYLKQDDVATLESGYKLMSQTFLRCTPYVSIAGLKPIIAESKPAVEKGITPEQMTDNSIVKSLEDSGFIKTNCK